MVSKTYDEIMESYKWLLPDGFDTREGSFANIVMSATALSAAELYEKLKIIEDNAYAITAVGEELDKTVAILGLTRRGKTKAVVKIEGETKLAVGDVVVGGEMEYEVVMLEEGYYLAECTTEGTAGNGYIGEVLPKEDKDGAVDVAITKIVALAEEEEDDEALRKRYIERINCPICTGNLSYYKNAIHSIAGVGGVKVVPAYDMVGTVKVIITNADYKAADEELVKYVKELLDPEATSGQGFGLVPIGHKVVVESAEEVDVSIVVESTGTSGSTYYDRMARTFLINDLNELNKEWDTQEKIVLWDRVIEDRYFSFRGVEDVNVVSINGVANRLILKENQILGGLMVNSGA